MYSSAQNGVSILTLHLKDQKQCNLITPRGASKIDTSDTGYEDGRWIEMCLGIFGVKASDPTATE